MTNVIAGLLVGALAGIILLFFSHLAPRFGAGNFIRDLDQPKLFGKTVTRREAHFVGAFAHVILSAVFGGVYAFLVQLEVLSGFAFLPILIWGGVVLTFFSGIIILPLEGHGLFGFKEDAWFPIDLVITNLVWAVLFWWLIGLWSGFVL